MTMIQYENGNSSITKKERLFVSIVFSVICILTGLDVYEDWSEGASLSHIIPEVLIILASACIVLYLFRQILHVRKNALISSNQEMAIAKQDALSWQSKAEKLRNGITDAISSQFVEWGLSAAEQEVSFLLLKGLSIQEIANVRETTARTVRQQASEVYKKSGLSGRAQLSAFFLEDLFDRPA